MLPSTNLFFVPSHWQLPLFAVIYSIHTDILYQNHLFQMLPKCPFKTQERTDFNSVLQVFGHLCRSEVLFFMAII